MGSSSNSAKRILISGASGLVGSALRAHLQLLGHEVYELTRSKNEHPSFSPKEAAHRIEWDPLQGHIELERLENFDVFIHLAGATIAKFPWSAKRKKILLDSRVKGLELLQRVTKSLKSPPKKVLTASGVGYYGDGKDSILTDASPKGSGFLPDLSEGISNACKAFSAPAVDMRFGIMLSEKGGMLKRLCPAFKLGLGAILGRGNMYVSWVHLSDAVRMITRCALDDSITSSVNITSPNPVTQKAFAKALAKALHRPLLLRVPKVLLRLLMGEASSLLLNSARAHPSTCFDKEIQHPELEEALHNLLFIDEAKIMHEPSSG